MQVSLTFNQHRFLKQLAEAQSEVLLSKLKPATKPLDRERVIQLGWVNQTRQKRAILLSVTDQGRAWIEAHSEPKPDFPTPAQRLFLLKLAFLPSGTAPTGLAGMLKKKDRAALEKHLIRCSKSGRTTSFELMDAGWKWVTDHFAEPIQGGAAQSALSEVLGRIHAYLQASGMQLNEFLRTSTSKRASNVLDPANEPRDLTPDLNSVIRDACLQLGNGQTKRRIRLADLRAALHGWDRAQVDQALLDLSLADPVSIVLGFIDDPADTRPEDRDAQFTTPSGNIRNILEWVGN